MKTKKQPKPRKLTDAQQLLAVHLKELGFREIEFEYQFHPKRKWRSDISALRDQGCGCFDDTETFLFECDGTSGRGHHARNWAIDGENERSNMTQALGYKVFRFTNRQILTGDAKAWLKEHLA